MKRVVITGLGVVSPLGNNVQTTWTNMINGINGIDRVTRFDATDFKSKLAAEVKDFDPLQYFAKSELRRTDLYTQYALAAATQAYEDSRLAGHIDSERFGVYFGSGIGGIQTFTEQAQVLHDKGPTRISPFFIPMMISNMASGTIAIKFKANGPNIAIVSACATSTHCIGEAFRAIKHGYADVMLAGGSEASITPLSYAGFINIQALSQAQDKNRASIPFDKERAGFIMGEGGAALILEELEHAKKRGAHIYAELVSYACTNDAFHATAPNPDAIASAKAIALTIQEGNITGTDIYINAHGTSTSLNDKTETMAIKRAFGDNAYKLHISSTKSMTGHMLGAAGAIEAIATVKALQEGIIPPTINYQVPDSDCDLNITPNKAVKREIQFALSNSLGFGGHNGCLGFKKYKN